MSATSWVGMMSTWSLFVRMTYIPTTEFHLPPPSSQYFHPEKKKGREGGKGLWNMLTQANEREEKRGRKHKETCTKKERKSCEELWRKYSSCGSSFPLESGKNCSTPLTQNTCGHITIQPRRPEVYGSLLGFGRRGIFCAAQT